MSNKAGFYKAAGQIFGWFRAVPFMHFQLPFFQLMLVKISVKVDLFTHLDFHGSRSSPSPAQSQDQEGDGGKGGLHVNA